MISNHIDEWFEACAEGCQLYELIPRELVVVSSAVSCCKPDAAIYEVFLERLAAAHPGLAAADCVFIDDKEPNVTAAEALGFRGLFFDASIASPGELERRLADF